ncbi:MAG: redoxin domain-containing protein [Pseudomonadota bacterium]
MNHTLKIVFLGLFVLAVVAWIYRQPLQTWWAGEPGDDMFVSEDNDAFDPGPALGSAFPGLRARHQGRDINLLTEFAGVNGLVLVASRSIDWCPYCMRQLIQLEQYRRTFEAAGIGLVVITYDHPQLQQSFVDEFEISIPILSDVDALSFKTLGILNRDYLPEDPEYGIAHPGMIIIDRNNTIVGKLFIEDYSLRIDSGAALSIAKRALGLPSPLGG